MAEKHAWTEPMVWSHWPLRARKIREMALAKNLGVIQQTVNTWISDVRARQKASRNTVILRLSRLRCRHEEIAGVVQRQEGKEDCKWSKVAQRPRFSEQIEGGFCISRPGKNAKEPIWDQERGKTKASGTELQQKYIK